MSGEVERIAPGVVKVATTRRDNAFLVEGEHGLTLVDVGWANAHRPLLHTVTDLGYKMGDIKSIILTHAHPDHAQGAAAMRELTGARILIHPAERGWLEAGRVPASGRAKRAGRLVDRLPRLHWTPFTADAGLRDGELVEDGGGLRVLHTPGHSPGHVALLHEPTRTLLAGDAVFHRDGLALGPAALAADPDLRAGSLSDLPRGLGAIGFAHGRPLLGAQVERFDAWLDALGDA